MSSFAPRTSQIIGRQALLSEIRQAIADEHGESHLIFLVGPGGIGKTRLLEEIARPLKQADQRMLFSTAILDLYHGELHSVDALRAAIISGLDPQQRYFSHYRALSQQYLTKMAAGIGGQMLAELRRELNTTFLDDYRLLAAERRIVLSFDTFEELMPETGVVQKVCAIPHMDTAATGWLRESVVQFANTVVLFAGRPVAGVTESFQDQLAAAGASFAVRNIAPLTAQETGASSPPYVTAKAAASSWRHCLAPRIIRMCGNRCICFLPVAPSTLR